MLVRLGATLCAALAAAIGSGGCEGPRGPAGNVPSPTPIAAAAVVYTGTSGGLSASDVQGAIDQLVTRNGLVVPVPCGPAINTAGMGADFGNWRDAVVLCRAACGVNAARPCSTDDVVHVLQAGGTLAGSGWVFSGAGCRALTSSALSETGAFWNGTDFAVRPCDYSETLLCCR